MPILRRDESVCVFSGRCCSSLRVNGVSKVVIPSLITTSPESIAQEVRQVSNYVNKMNEPFLFYKNISIEIMIRSGLRYVRGYSYCWIISSAIQISRHESVNR